MDKELEYISFEGTDEELNEFLGGYFEKAQIPLVRHCLGTLYDALDETETLRAETEDHQEIGLILPGGNYFLNVRKTTIALLGLVLDIAYTRGFASFVLQMFGVTADKIRKLSADEKQILLWINAGKISIDRETSEYIYADENCGFSSDQIRKIIDKLAEDEVVRNSGDTVKICI